MAKCREKAQLESLNREELDCESSENQ